MRPTTEGAPSNMARFERMIANLVNEILPRRQR
jgi:hypothetical protein